MRTRRTGLIWFLVCGLPMLVIQLVGLVASLVGVFCLWTDGKCRQWLEELDR